MKKSETISTHNQPLNCLIPLVESQTQIHHQTRQSRKVAPQKKVMMKCIPFRSVITTLVSATVTLITVAAQGQAIPVPNGSFESRVVNPQVFPIDTRIDSWQKMPQPSFFTNSPQLTWDQTVGMFNGTPTYSPNPYSNLNGNQAAYLLSIPGAG